MRGLGNGGVVQDGLFFIVDSFNLKSYIPPVGVPTTSNTTGASYSGFALNRVSDNTQQPIVFGIVGDVQSAWTGYINGGSISLLLGGGSILETYVINNALYDTSTNMTALYPNLTANFVTMSHTHSMGNWYGGGTNFIKMDGNFSIFNIYLSNTTPLIFSLTGGGGPVISSTVSGASYSRFALNRVSDNTQQPIVIGVPGDVSSLYSSYISSNGGTLSMSLSGGATPEVYNVNVAFYDSTNNTTVLYPNPSGYVTMSHTCSIIDYFGYPNWINISGVDLSNIFSIYITNNGNYLTFSLSGGLTPSSYVINNAFFDGFDTWLYDSLLLGAPYNDHTQFEVLVPEIVSTLYTDNTTFTFSYPYSPETYSVDSFYYDGVNTFLYDSGYIGASYTDHTQFEVLVPEMVGTLYTDHTNATYSYINITPQTASYDMTQRNHNNSLDNGVGFNGRDFTFDGIDDNINVGDIGTFSDFTLDMWFKSTSITDYKNLIDFNSFNTCLRIEQYTAPGYTHTWKNRTNNAASGVTRMSVNFNGSGDGFGIGGDCPGTLVENQWYNLVAICDSVGTIIPQYDCISYWDGLVIGNRPGPITGPKLPLVFNSGYLTWDNYISASGGLLTLTFSNGTYSATYSVVTAKYINANQTLLLPNANSGVGETYSGNFELGDYSGIKCIRLNDFSTYSSTTYPYGALFDKYFAAWTSLTMSLYSGTYSETYIVDSVAYSAPYYYVYDSLLTGLVTGITNSASVGYTASLPELPEVDPNIASPFLYNYISANVSANNIFKVYLNNEKLLDWIGASPFVGYASNMRIGDGYDYSSRRFQGSIPYVALYDRPLSDEEISNNYNSLKWRFI